MTMRERTIVMFPGQGSQFSGMGNGLWESYPELVREADAVLGYSIRELCAGADTSRLNRTEFTQPAMFVVNALGYREYLKRETPPAALIGHSLGELNALHAAGAFDFAQGLKIVAKRAEIMSRAPTGRMAVVVGMTLTALRTLLLVEGIEGVDVANHNSRTQLVLAGAPDALERAKPHVTARGARYIPLNVSGAFHSRLMSGAAREFHRFLSQLSFGPLQIPVVANATAEPYADGSILECLTAQLASPVRWHDTILGLRAGGAARFVEVGPKHVLTNLLEHDDAPQGPRAAASGAEAPETARRGAAVRRPLGAQSFLSRYGMQRPLVSGSMYRGVASVELVRSMARAGFLAFFGAGGLSLDEVGKALGELRESLPQGAPFGCNVLFDDRAEYESRLVDVLLASRIRNIEVSAYIRPTPGLVRFKAAGLGGAPGSGGSRHRIIVKLSRPDVAEAFLRPPEREMLDGMVREGTLERALADHLARRPIADDITVEADSGGHTDKGQLPTLLPAVVSMRDRLAAEFPDGERVHVGAGGGIGDPWAAVAAFLLGAEYLVTGSINQCTVEAGTSDRAKDILAALDLHDTAYAPAGDLFELGSEVQVVKRGTFFPGRARKLYELYVHHRRLEDIEPETRDVIERKYFGRSFGAVWEEVEKHQRESGIDPDATGRDPKAKMAAVFKWYFHKSALSALRGDEREKANYQIHCGPAMGAFNRWVRGTELEPWRSRRAPEISERLLADTDRLHARMVA